MEHRRSQYLSELALLILIVVLVITGMQTYFRRAVNAKIKTGVDASISVAQQAANDFTPANVFDQAFTSAQEVRYGPRSDDLEPLLQYEPYYKEEQTNTTPSSATVERTAGEDFDFSDDDDFVVESYSTNTMQQKSKTRFNFENDRVW